METKPFGREAVDKEGGTREPTLCGASFAGTIGAVRAVARIEAMLAIPLWQSGLAATTVDTKIEARAIVAERRDIMRYSGPMICNDIGLVWLPPLHLLRHGAAEQIGRFSPRTFMKGGFVTTYTAEITWTLAEGEDFRAGRYSRGHAMAFDGGARIAGSASPHVVGKRWSVESAVDPEEMLVAALSSCHMLSFLYVAQRAGFAIAAYRDRAEGTMAEIAPGRQAVTSVVLHPSIDWEGDAPDDPATARLHHEAHELCFIANSVKTEIVIAPA